MGLIADILLVAAALGATFYCVVLSRRLNRFTDLENGVGGAIAALSAQVDDMTRTLQSAQGSASASANSLGQLTGKAEDAARRLELLVASMHDLPELPSRSSSDASAASVATTPEATEDLDDVSSDADSDGTQPPGTDSDAPDPGQENVADSEDGAEEGPPGSSGESDPDPEPTDEDEGAGQMGVFSSRRSKATEAA